jgi:hypothetical protein
MGILAEKEEALLPHIFHFSSEFKPLRRFFVF